MTTIKTKNFILRPVKLSDAKLFFEAEQDEEARKNFMTTPVSVEKVEEDIKDEIEQYKSEKPKSEKFTIEFEGKVAGWIAINQLNVPFFEHRAKIYFCLHPDFRGKGIISEAVKEVTKYAFEKYKLKRIEGWCRTFNKASQRVFEKNGYQLEGTLRKNKCKNGEYLDDVIWAIVK
jgi:ribosomal-protein-alanine N-acetyltransferase